MAKRKNARTVELTIRMPMALVMELQSIASIAGMCEGDIAAVLLAIDVYKIQKSLVPPNELGKEPQA